jgi:hypothetical protein
MSMPASDTIGRQVGIIDSCVECGNQFKVQDSPRPNHCSEQCFYEDRGSGALNALKTDHKLCATCFKYIKKTYCPSADFLEELSSFEHRALQRSGKITNGPDGELQLDITGVDGSTRPLGIRKDGSTREFVYIGRQYPTQHTRYLYGSSGPWVCECGNVDLSEHNELLANQDTEGMVLALLDRLREFYEKGAIQQEPQRGVFFEYFDERDADLRTSVGAALYREG